MTLLLFGILISIIFIGFLAHLSRRLTRWAYSIPVEPASVRQCVCVHTFKHEYLRNQSAGHNRILTEASLGGGGGGGEAAFGFGWDRIRSLVSMATDRKTLWPL